MKRIKLNLDQLGEELGLLDPGYLQGIKGGYGSSSGSYGGYNSWQELWDAMQNGYLPPAGTYNPGGSGSYGSYGNYGGYSGYGGYNGGWPGWYPPGTGGGYGEYGSGSYGSYGGYGGYGGYASYGGPFPRITFNNLWNAYPRQNLHPSNDGYENQCAIRLGKALQDAFDIDFTDSSYTKFGPVTTEGYPRGAKSLADYLESNLPGVKKMSYAEWSSSPYKNSEGIIFLKAPQGGVHHIDVYSCGVTGSGMYYAEEVWFWPLEDH